MVGPAGRGWWSPGEGPGLVEVMDALKLWAVSCRLQLPQVMGNLRLQQLAGYVLVRHQSTFTLAWDGTSAVYIKMSPEFLGWTHGLCGNNNADPQDDLVTSYGEAQARWPPKGFWSGWGIGWAGRSGKGLGTEPWGHGIRLGGGQRPLPSLF